ncbi:uncharacterized protein LOC132947339 isoform X1 [Metopolophium dirhodum]|uniref:uncharacterized protein LOC132947339 isoform X1 n=1 Tax=Metopolophium dirhodum TaxID=44670 RepID=UPI0029905359|nr:uncharacterized protein LOC132947339 isoform X1 [Metopolophium dirhodum]
MVYKCVVPNCGVIYANASKIKFYRFPTDEVLKSKWMKSCSITKHLVSYKVCDNHFLPEDIKDNGRLMPSAVPSLHLGVNVDPNSENSSQTDISTNSNSKPNGADSLQRSDEVLKSKWMKSCSNTKHLVSYKVCDNNFLPEDIKDNGRLMLFAVPSIQLGVNVDPNSENSSQTDINTNNNSKPNGADSLQRSDEVLKSKWMKSRSNTKHLVSYKVCDNHFLPEDIKDNGRLMSFAVPSIQPGVNLDPNSENSSQTDISTNSNSKPNGADSLQRSDEVLKSKWMKSCSNTKHLVSYKVCDNNFLPEDIKDNGRLMLFAVPSIQLGVNLDPNSENSSQTDISTNSNSKPNGADSPQRSDTSTSLITNISPTQTSKKGKFSLKYPRYFNDLTVEHFSTPIRAEIYLAFAKQKHNDVRKKLKKVQQQNRRLAEKLKCINISKQKDSNHLTENASQLMQMPSF